MTGPQRRFRPDSSMSRHGEVVIGGSPLKLFRLGMRGMTLLDRISRGDAVPPSPLVDRLLDTGTIHPIPTRGRWGPDDVTVVRPVHRRDAGDDDDLVVRGAGSTIVVDDASPVPVGRAAVRFESNRGPAAARNAGLALVTTPVVAFVDADVDVDPAWLEGLLGHFEDDRVALVAPRVRSIGARGLMARAEHRHSPLDLGPDPGRIRAGTRIGYVPAAALVCRADAVRSIGGFDETLRVGEDVDLVWRLDEAGWRCRYEPSVVVAHRARPDWPAWIGQRVTYGTSAAPLARRHPGALAPLRVSGWSLAAWGAAVVALPRRVPLRRTAGPAVGVGITVASSAALVRTLRGVPPAVSFRLAFTGTVRAGSACAAAVRRVWWPIVAIAAVWSRTARRVALWSVLAAVHPIRLLDDAAYGTGVWAGMWRERSAAPLVPEITSWPNRRREPTRRRIRRTRTAG